MTTDDGRPTAAGGTALKEAETIIGLLKAKGIDCILINDGLVLTEILSEQLSSGNQ